MKIIALGVLTMLGAMTGGCVMAVGNTNSDTRPVAIERETISYETSPCFGTCPVYRVTIQPNGAGVFEGKRFTKVNGIREFRASPDQYRAFAAKLERYRPRQGEQLIQPGRPGCQNAPTDMPSVDIRWNEASGASQHLSFYYGCAMLNQAMNEALRSAPNELPIRAFIEPN
jgi:hypothetical protein